MAAKLIDSAKRRKALEAFERNRASLLVPQKGGQAAPLADRIPPSKNEKGRRKGGKNHNGRLLMAASTGVLDEASDALGKGADVNARDSAGWTPLMFASFKGHVEIVKLLLANSADLDAKNNEGQSALKLALKAGNADIAARLREKGAGLG